MNIPFYRQLVFSYILMLADLEQRDFSGSELSLAGIGMYRDRIFFIKKLLPDAIFSYSQRFESLTLWRFNNLS